MSTREIENCEWCDIPLKAGQVRHCSHSCRVAKQHDEAVQKWLNGETSGLNAGGTVTNTVKKWLRTTRGDACELCGWKERNPYTNLVPVVADHIDGDWRNNRPENLRLVCPNCDSLQKTYKGANRGKGRPQRK